MKLIKNSVRLDFAHGLKSSVILAIWWRVLITIIFALLVIIAYHQGFVITMPILAILIPGVVLGILLIFRINIAHNRFWEGCKLWYDSIEASRILCRNIWTIIPTKNPEELRVKIAYMRLVGILVIAIKLSLRNEDINIDNSIKIILEEELYSELKDVNNVPIRIINWFAEYFCRLFHDRRSIDIELFIELNHSLDRITMLLSGYERVSNLTYRPYSIYFKNSLLIYCCALPLHFVEKLDWVTFPIVGMISFVILGVEEITIQNENLFDCESNKLCLDRYCQQLQSEIEIEWVNCDVFTAKSSDISKQSQSQKNSLLFGN